MATARGRSRRSGDAAGRRWPLATRFTIRYIAALVAFGLVAVVALVGVRSVLARVEDNTEALLLANQQPSRVHRIMELARDLQTAGAADDLRGLQDASSRLRQEAGALRSTQAEVLGLEPGESPVDADLPPALRDLYLGSRQLDLRISDFSSKAEELSGYSAPSEDANRARLVDQLAEEEDQLIVDLDSAISYSLADTQRAVQGQRDADLLVATVAALVAGAVVVVLFRPMARSIRTETANLEAAERQQRENSERQTFRNELTKALEVCGEEHEVVDAVGRALATAVPGHPAELLMHAEDRAGLRVAVANPDGGGAGCPVDDPSACAALRAGQTMVYESSRMLNVCPKLPQHAGGPCSAVCVPLVFNGEALGVLHATAPENQVVGTPLAERCSVLGQVTASRLGTLRITQATERLAARDVLTDLDNRRTLLAKTAALLDEGRHFSVAVADLDHFKDLNDTYGHETGDRALQLFSDSLRRQLRPEDIVARWGGEEFVVVLPDTPIDAAALAVERLRAALADDVAAESSVPFTASWGLTDTDAGVTFAEVLNVADLAMYEAKRSGRDRLVVDPEAVRRHLARHAEALDAATDPTP